MTNLIEASINHLRRDLPRVPSHGA